MWWALLNKVVDEWPCNLSKKFIVFNSFKSPNRKQSVNNSALLSHESMLKGDKDKIVPYSIGIHFKMVQNSTSNYEGWHHAKLFQFLY